MDSLRGKQSKGLRTDLKGTPAFTAGEEEEERAEKAERDPPLKSEEART